ncbi:ABC transporter substrate-binding protein [Pontiella agarivorans]|uniref:ABC transporter substrate-binding protein n=1 Tax=Pontiella agarivorans TaxID=3038953 RepID=A0ABU5MTE8_9BACT|nr:ABC transporter substrate-binding protein [Pontiella agarivorans]MDZ8117412.1 ABC transporter substrate-binding protein [Pontiella agarivorans]
MAFRPPVIRLLLAVSTVIAGSFLLFGCGGKEGRFPVKPGETVQYGQTSRIRGLDPGISGEVSSSMAISKLYEGLLEYDYLARPYKVIPALAESVPEVSEDGLVYTFTIRKGIYFHDNPCFPDGKGRELNARDFVYSFKRVADVKNASSGFWVFNNRIKGIDAFHDASKGEEPTDYSMDVEGLQALDDYTLQITLLEPYPQLLYILAMHYAFVVPHEAVEFYGKEFVNNPVGTGPYELVEWRRNSRIEFYRSPKWAETGRVERYPSKGTPEQVAAGLLKDAGKPIPFNDRVVQFVIDDATTSWMMFLAGQLGASSISPDNWDAVVMPDKSLSSSLSGRGIELISSPYTAVYYLGFNWDDPVVGEVDDPAQNLRNRKLRQALSCAYEFDVMNQFMNNRLYPVEGPIPSPLAGELKEPSPYRFNLEKAKRLLAEAGYPGGINPKTGKRLEINIEMGSADANTRQSTALLADMFEKIGVVLKANYNTWPAFIEKMNRRQAQTFRLAWVADYPDAENFLQLFYSKNESPGPNHSNYRNAEIDRLYEKVRIMPDSPERTALYEKMSRIIVEDAPWIFQFQPMSFAVKHRWIENYIPHDYPYGMGKYRRSNPEIRKAWMESYGDKKLDMTGQE